MKKHKRWFIGTLLKLAVSFLILSAFASFDVLYGVLFGFLFMFGIAAWELKLFTRKSAHMREFMPDWLKYLLQGGVFIVLDILLLLMKNVFFAEAFDAYAESYLLNNSAAANPMRYYALFFLDWALTAALVCEAICLLLTLIIGGARTVLFRDKHGLKGN